MGSCASRTCLYGRSTGALGRARVNRAPARDIMRGMTEAAMTAPQAAELLGDVKAAGIRCWAMGGWGVDALVGHQTRAHHDLDVLVAVDDLPALSAWLRSQGFTRAYEWEENCRVPITSEVWDTAFVELHPDGRSLDVHAVHPFEDPVRLATMDPWHLPSDALSGVGQIDGHEVSCVSANCQRSMHVGYDLPDRHLEDLRRLEGL